MACTSQTEWLEARIEATREAIVAIETAITALAGGAQSYSLDTGQSRQSVTKADIGSLRLQLDSLDNRLTTLCARLNGAGIRVVPSW